MRDFDDDEMELIGACELEGDTPEDMLEGLIEFIWTMPIPEEHKMDIEGGLRQQFLLDPGMFDHIQREGNA